MSPNTRLLDLIGIELPIIQAPMAGSSGIEMAVAVSETGGLGSLPCALLDANQLRAALAEVTARTSKPVNINFFTHSPPGVDNSQDDNWLDRLSPYYKELDVEPPKVLSSDAAHTFDDAACRVLEARPPAIVSFHFGLPSEALTQRLKAAGIKIMSSATTVQEAEWLVGRGCDAVIAQGYEAGGHRGMFLTEDTNTQMGTMSLVPQIVDAVGVPVIAAGGIADGRGVAAAFALGASAAQVGTAYLFTDEAMISDIYRDALLSVKSVPTTFTNVFSGRPARCVENRVLQDIGPLTDVAPAFPKGFSAITPLRIAAEQQGRPDFSAHYCGQSAALGVSSTAGQLTLDLAASVKVRPI